MPASDARPRRRRAADLHVRAVTDHGLLPEGVWRVVGVKEQPIDAVVRLTRPAVWADKCGLGTLREAILHSASLAINVPTNEHHMVATL